MKLIRTIIILLVCVNMLSCTQNKTNVPIETVKQNNIPSTHIEEGSIYPNDLEYINYQSHYLKLIGYETAYKLEYDGTGVTIAIVDSGITTAHEDLDSSNILKGYNYTTDNTEDTVDRTGHGTFIAGIIGAKTDNNVGITGITPNVRIIPIKCFDTNLKTDINTVIRCIEKAIELNVDVINLSFCTPNNSTELENVINKAIEQGIIIVASSGNDNTGEKMYPASYENVVSVNSINVSRIGLKVTESIKSNANDSVIVSAPGDDILSLSFTNIDEYKQRSGSSYASALVSSIAIMVKQHDKTIDANKFIDLLKITSLDYGHKEYDNIYGYGVINVKNILSKLD